MGTKRELDVERECLVWLNSNGFFAWKNPTLGVYDVRNGSFRRPAPFTIRGASDALAISPDGIVIFIEFKSDKGRQSKEQALFEKQIKEHRGHYCLVKSLGELQNAINIITAKGIPRSSH